MYPDSISYAHAHVQDRMCVLCDHIEPIHSKRERKAARGALLKMWQSVLSVLWL
jgi:hypothetical protein